jgi:hypothetical protein
MNVELLYFDGCPKHPLVLAHLRELLSQIAPTATLQQVRLNSDQQAQAERFLGSPTIRVNGSDIEPHADARHDYGMRCRLYRSPDGLTGIPTEKWLVAALRNAAES